MRILFAAMFAVGCAGGGDSPAEPGSASDGDACVTLADCADGLVCLAVGPAPGACVPDCSVSADECGASAQCGPVGAGVVDACQPPESIADENNPPEEDSRTALVCTSDAECAALDPNAICATWRGHSECTLACSNDAMCNPPELMGVSMEFAVCIPDEGDESRTACLPNEQCFSDPMSCISFGGGSPF